MKNKWLLLLVIILAAAAFFVRIARVDELLGFYYDQGRDGLVIWNFWTNGKLFLVGPTTGIAGLFRGPWYYFLIAPFYLIGGGNPVVPAVFLSTTSVVAILLLVRLAKDAGGIWAAMIAGVVASMSYYLVLASRWLSNPTPMLLISMVFVTSLVSVYRKKNSWWWVVVAASFAMAMQFGSATEIFYIPVIAIVAIKRRTQLLKNKKILLLSAVVVVITFAPQFLFGLRHEGLLFDTMRKFLFEDKSFRLSFTDMLSVRLPLYLDVFGNKILPGDQQLRIAGLAFVLFMVITRAKQLFASDVVRLSFVLFLSPLVGMLFFQGNFGNVYDYYFTGYYLVFVLLFAHVLAQLTKTKIGQVIVLGVMVFFLSKNLPIIGNYLSLSIDNPSSIVLANQKRSLDWIYSHANGEAFSVEVYVPPVIPYSYDYLFTWIGTRQYGYTPAKSQTQIIYTLFEADPPHPERLSAWLAQQDMNSTVVTQASFGGIGVQQRKRN